MPALDSAAGHLVQSKQLKHYGKSRSWGSIGFVVAGLILTVLTGSFGDSVILWILLLGIMVFIVLVFLRAPVILSEKPKNDPTKKVGYENYFESSILG